MLTSRAVRRGGTCICLPEGNTREYNCGRVSVLRRVRIGDHLSEQTQKAHREPRYSSWEPFRYPARQRKVEVNSCRRGRPTLICRRRHKALDSDIDGQPHVLVTRSIKAGVAGQEKEAAIKTYCLQKTYKALHARQLSFARGLKLRMTLRL